MLIFSTMTEAWNSLYLMLKVQGETVSTRNGSAKHLTNISFKLTNPLQSIVYSSLRRMSPKYLAAELIWYLSGSNKVEFIGKYAKMWNNLTDDGETVNSAYGFLLYHNYGFDQVKHVVKLLKEDIQTRQAVIHFKPASDKKSKDVPCTLSMQFVVFKGRLNGHVYMRSNDIWFGTPYDVAYFTLLLQIVSELTGIPIGEYVHTVGDLHVYNSKIKVMKNETLSGPDFKYDSSLIISLGQYLAGLDHILPPKALKRLEEISNGKV